MLVGYARVSTTHQSLDVQLEQLAAHGVEKIFQEQLDPLPGDPGLTAPAALRCLQDSWLWRRLSRVAPGERNGKVIGSLASPAWPSATVADCRKGLPGLSSAAMPAREAQKKGRDRQAVAP